MIEPMTDPAFLDAVEYATLPGLCCHIERGMAGTFLVLTPHRSPLLRQGLGGNVYATPCWEGTAGIAVSIEREGSVYTDTIPCEFSGDGVEDAHRYLGAMRRWQRTLPTLYARWDCDPDTDFAGTVLDLCAQYDQSNLWEPLDWDYDEFMSLLDILDDWSKCPDGVDLATRGDNMVIRTTPFPIAHPCDGCGESVPEGEEYGGDGEWRCVTCQPPCEACGLHDYQTGSALRPATEEELQSSIEAARRDGGTGVIEIDGRPCFVA